MSLSSDGKRIASAAEDRTIKIWEVETGDEKATLKGHQSRICSVSLSSDGKRVFSSSGSNFRHIGAGDRPADEPGEIKVWDAETGQEMLALKGQTGGVSCVSLSSDGNRLVTGIGSLVPSRRPGEIKVWDAETGK